MTSLLDRAMMRFMTVHDTLYQRSNGWIGHRIPFAPRMLLLHSTGAKTGALRTHSLAYYRDGEERLGSLAVQNRQTIGYDEMPQLMKDAVVAAEYDDPDGERS